jgi:hypothetical protein
MDFYVKLWLALCFVLLCYVPGIDASELESLLDAGMAHSLPITNSTASRYRGGINVPLDVHGYPVAPEELVLQQVHVFIRHGEQAL